MAVPKKRLQQLWFRTLKEEYVAGQAGELIHAAAPRIQEPELYSILKNPTFFIRVDPKSIHCFLHRISPTNIRPSDVARKQCSYVLSESMFKPN
jgi:hypothetical protein